MLGRRDILLGGALSALAAGGAILTKRLLPEVSCLASAEKAARTAIASEPVITSPHADLKDVIPLDQTHDLLVTLLPTWFQAVKTDNLLHAFRLWGPSAEFPEDLFTHPFVDRHVFSGAEMEQVFMNSEAFSRVFPLDPPLLKLFSDGVVARIGFSNVEGGHIGALVHQDNLLTAFAELGYPSNTPIIAVPADARVDNSKGSFPGVQAALSDLVQGAISYFSPRQELEWTIEALVRYLAPQQEWTNRFGETFTFNDVAGELLRRVPGEGSCIGLHTVYALVCLFRVNMQHRVLADGVAALIERYLQRRSQALDADVDSKEYSFHRLDNKWPAAFRNSTEDRSEWMDANQLTYVSHHLEWIAYARRPLAHPCAISGVCTPQPCRKGVVCAARSGSVGDLLVIGSNCMIRCATIIIACDDAISEQSNKRSKH
jgi:hypothetical protein